MLSLKHIITNTENKELNSPKWFKQPTCCLAFLFVSLYMVSDSEDRGGDDDMDTELL